MIATLYQKSDPHDIETEVEVEDRCVAKWDEGWVCGGEIEWKETHGLCKQCNASYEEER